MAKSDDCLVFVPSKETTCGECGREVFGGELITLRGERGALCLACADLDHLVWLSPGDAALTRRARKHSTLSAVVLKWSKARKRYERQGVLVEEAALAQAEEECLGDQEARDRRRARAEGQRQRLDEEYIQRFAAEVRRLYPSAPAGTEDVVARRACLRRSGRVGRSAAAKELDPGAIRLAVVAHARHAHTAYDELLSRGYERDDARAEIADQVHEMLVAWKG